MWGWLSKISMLEMSSSIYKYISSFSILQSFHPKVLKMSHLHVAQPRKLYSFKFEIVGNKAKRRISNRVFQKNKARQIFRKKNISYPLISTRTRAYQGVRNICFSENLVCFVFLKHPFWDSPFCLITDEIANWNLSILLLLFNLQCINFFKASSGNYNLPV